MKIVRNDIIPAKGYKAMTVWPFIFVRRGSTFTPTDERHERIHGRQQVELLLLPFYILLVLFYLVGLLRHGNHRMAYRGTPFEAEAYMNENDTAYLDNRKWYAWTKYIGKKKYKKETT